jgi:hypothetical protein
MLLAEMPNALQPFTRFSVISARSCEFGRPLFVPAGIQRVHTGPTTPEELARLLADAEPTLEEVSQVRRIAVQEQRWWVRCCVALGFVARRLRPRRVSIPGRNRPWQRIPQQ